MTEVLRGTDEDRSYWTKEEHEQVSEHLFQGLNNLYNL